MKDIQIRLATPHDVDDIRELEKRVWPDFSASKEMITSRLAVFPEGNYIAVDREKNTVVGYLCLMFLGYEEQEFPHSFGEITSNGTIQNHDPNGKYVYGLNMSVDKGYNLGMQLQVHGWCLMVKYRRRGCFLGSPIPGFAAYKAKHPETTAEEYVFKKRKNGSPIDPELAYYHAAGFELKRVFENYEPDPKSLDYGVLVYRSNSFYYLPFRSCIAWLIKEFGFKLLRMFGV